MSTKVVKRCCNPFQRDGHNWVRKILRPVGPALQKKFPDLGEYVCMDCRIKLYKCNTITPSDNNEVIDMNHNCASGDDLDLPSPISEQSSVEMFLENDIGQELLRDMKELFINANCVADKIKYRTMTPRSWSIRELELQFDCSYRMACKAKTLQSERGFGSSPDPRPSRTLCDDVVSHVVEFYCSDEISRIMPGQKDFVTLRDVDGSKHQVQKRLVLCDLKEAYAAFKQQHPNDKIGFTKFAELRPKQCILAGPTGTHTVCVCKIHQNVKLMLVAVSSICQTFKRTYHDLIKQISCDSPNPLCHLGDCSSCPSFDVVTHEMESLFDDNFIENISYKRWTYTDRSVLEMITQETETFLETLKEQTMALKKHDFVAKQQSGYLKDRKSRLQPGEFLVLGDFAENYAFVVQDEIQSFHWNNNQATIHPFVVYYVVNEGLQHKSFVIISENLQHNTVAVHLFQKKLISRLFEFFGSEVIKKMIYFTGGASAQYKNKSNFINLTHHFDDFNVEVEWHFFPTSHGKSPCDGIGGTVKRCAARASLQRPNENHILTPRQLFEWSVSALKNITFDFCSNSEHEEREKFLKPRLNQAITVEGIRRFHSFLPLSIKTVECRVYSSSDESFTRKSMR